MKTSNTYYFKRGTKKLQKLNL